MRLNGLALVACVACSSSVPIDGGAPADAPVGEARVELGSGERAWQALPLDGSGACELVHGPQGGYHIYGRVRYSGLPSDVSVWFRVTALDDGATLTNDGDRLRRVLGRGLAQTATGYESVTGELVILQIAGPAQAAGRRVRFDVRVVDAAGGLMATDAREVTIVDAVR